MVYLEEQHWGEEQRRRETAENAGKEAEAVCDEEHRTRKKAV
jgi:hypothetical protein